MNIEKKNYKFLSKDAKNLINSHVVWSRIPKSELIKLSFLINHSEKSIICFNYIKLG